MRQIVCRAPLVPRCNWELALGDNEWEEKLKQPEAFYLTPSLYGEWTAAQRGE